MRNLLVALLAVLLILSVLLPRLDLPQRNGEITLPSLTGPVNVRRGDDGVPYIFAESLDDALTAQGFVMAQDRLFQMELLRHLSQGRLAEFIGERGLANDRIIRIVNIPGLARDYSKRISSADRNYLQRYIDGINAVIADPDQQPLMLGVMGYEPQPWTIEDALSYQFFAIWSSSVNWKQELLTLRLIEELGAERAAQLRPLSFNPDDPAPPGESSAAPAALSGIHYRGELDNPWQARYAMGSDAWATDSRKSAGGKPILSSDPHIDARNLPGFWYPIGVVTPELRFVGAATPAVPGIGVGRNEHIAWGATNGYADVVDLFIETVDPSNEAQYLEGDNTFRFHYREEVLRIRDRNRNSGYRIESMTVRETRRGPVISDHGIEISDGQVISLRWSMPEFLGPDAGNRELLMARSVDEALLAIGKTPTPLNYVVVDTAGNIARQSAGLVPRRLVGEGLVPLLANSEDNWAGRIPAAEMPRQYNPARGWVGSTNNRVVPADYPYPYSTHFSGSWRYQRLTQLMEQPGARTTGDHWAANMDTKNLLAERMRPAIVNALSEDTALHQLRDLLQDWDLMDDQAQAAPLIFQSILRHFAQQTFADDLSPQLLTDYLDEPYYWQERLLSWFEHNASPWFEDQRSELSESRDDIIRRAAKLASEELSELQGTDPTQWRWGQAHTVTFTHPFVPGETAARWLGGGVHPLSGSGETLLRGVYPFSQPYQAKIIDSIRMIIDLSDDEKVEANYPGGASERWFDPWNKNFLDAWLTGEKRYLWFSEDAIRKNTDTELLLQPPK